MPVDGNPEFIINCVLFVLKLMIYFIISLWIDHDAQSKF